MFDPARADFGGMMVGPSQIAVSEIVHEAYLNVDECGTEAAACTSIDFQITSTQATSKPRRFIADHPFLFAVADMKLGRILFVGQVVDPSS